MLFKRIKNLRKEVFERGTSYYSLGKDIFESGLKVYNDRKASNSTVEQPEPTVIPKAAKSTRAKKAAKAPKVAEVEEVEEEAPQFMDEDPSKKALRKNLAKNFTVPSPNDPAELARQTSLHSHQVKDQDPGEKFNSNMWQRNYDNHQGN
ncbi:MAG TPA: hypothetical protein VNJ08_16785 [Bacteriovoracaceae bacterium]|nr:hypothetical protein [Bacteriovoracaceae bacterium]